MRAIVVAVLLAGCGGDGGSGDSTCKVNDAPCCDAPALDCDAPTRSESGLAYLLNCPDAYQGFAQDGTLYSWGDQHSQAQAQCWPGGDAVFRVINADGSKVCFDRDGHSTDCATAEPEWTAAITPFLQAHNHPHE